MSLAKLVSFFLVFKMKQDLINYQKKEIPKSVFLKYQLKLPKDTGNYLLKSMKIQSIFILNGIMIND